MTKEKEELKKKSKSQTPPLLYELPQYKVLLKLVKKGKVRYEELKRKQQEEYKALMKETENEI